MKTIELLHLTPVEAWDSLKDNQGSFLFDIRTEPEIIFVGAPDLRSMNKCPFQLPWQMYPRLSHNQRFFTILKDYLKQGMKTAIFLCRDGKISKDAALETRAHLPDIKSMCIEGGFDGDLETSLGRRGMLGGWKFYELPWCQL